MLRQYIQRFSQVRNTIPHISPAAIIMAFSEGITNKRLVGKLETHNVETISELFGLEDKYAWEAEAYARVERWALLRNRRRAMTQNLAPRRTSGRLLPSWPWRGCSKPPPEETLWVARGILLLPAKMEESGASFIAPTGTTSPSAAS